MHIRFSRSRLLPALFLATALCAFASGEAVAQQCAYQRDGECDEPGIGTDSCALGTDLIDCAGIGYDTCELAHNGRCDEPNGCPIGSDTADCRPTSILGADDCRYAFDGECDEPDIGTGSCPAGTDTADCRSAALDPPAETEPGSLPESLTAACPFVGDGTCDEPGIGTGLCDAGADFADCGSLSGSQSGSTAGSGIAFEHSCPYSFDAECDEPGAGTGACEAGTDSWDCALPERLAGSTGPAGGDKPALLPARPDPSASGSCLFFGDGQCDEPDIGTGLCPANSDGLDCATLRP